VGSLPAHLDAVTTIRLTGSSSTPSLIEQLDNHRHPD
jgi:hypothetical protein